MKTAASILCLIVMLAAAPAAQAAQPCFLVLTVKEKDRLDGTSQIVLYSARAVAGPFQQYYNPMNTEVYPYLIRARSAAGAVLERASFPTLRLTFTDGKSNSNITETPWAAQDVYLPFNRDIVSIEIVYDGKKGTFPLNAAALTCQKTCTEEGESILIPVPEGGLICCPGLRPQRGEQGFTCAK